METTHVLLIMGIIVALTALGVGIRNSIRDKNPKNQLMDEEKRREFESMMQEGEKLLASCTTGKKRYCAISDRRFLIETKEGLKEIDLKDIKDVTAKNFRGDNTVRPSDMAYIQIKADKKYNVSNCSGEFEAFAKEMIMYRK